MVRFKVQSWNPQPTAIGSLAGWFLVLAGTSFIFLTTLGISEQYVPRWLAYLGRISYGLYLFHSFVFFLVFEKAKPALNGMAAILHLNDVGRDTVGTILVLCLSVLLAHLSYRHFEAFFLKLKRRFTLVASRD
jgi:peptidoglycan/LPS O-acetylase OafA/YrhL